VWDSSAWSCSALCGQHALIRLTPPQPTQPARNLVDSLLAHRLMRGGRLQVSALPSTTCTASTSTGMGSVMPPLRSEPLIQPPLMRALSHGALTIPV